MRIMLAFGVCTPDTLGLLCVVCSEICYAIILIRRVGWQHLRVARESSPLCSRSHLGAEVGTQGDISVLLGYDNAPWVLLSSVFDVYEPGLET